MARKNLLSNLMSDPGKFTAVNSPSSDQAPSDAAKATERPSPGFKGIGALGAVTRSIDALAAKADAAKEIEAKLVAGETVIDLNPDQIEDSFVSDRLIQQDEQFQELVEAIRLRGQDSPILVRPHPQQSGKYQIAFGHRRARAARVLGRPVRAVVKQLADRDHVIAQGQENSARADLSFLERAMFAGELERRGFDRETIMAALSADKTTVSKMLSVVNKIPKQVLDAIGPALSVGRDRWHDLSTQFDDLSNEGRALEFVRQPHFQNGTPDERFTLLSGFLIKRDAPGRLKESAGDIIEWQRPNGAIRADIKANARQYTIALKAADATAFGAFITENLDRLYEAFQQQKSKAGD
ncbi:MAG: plasmid partitioning protein RepB [Shinella sp.]|nr:plasmid partitioning protein RepB [Shinella sp.]